MPLPSSLPPPLPPPASPSVKLTIETLADLFGLKVCSHGDLGIRFGAGPVLASEETVRIIRAAIEGLCAQESAQVDEMRAALRQICEGEGRGSGWSPEMALGRVTRLQVAAEELKQQRNASDDREDKFRRRLFKIESAIGHITGIPYSAHDEVPVEVVVDAIKTVRKELDSLADEAKMPRGAHPTAVREGVVARFRDLAERHAVIDIKPTSALGFEVATPTVRIVGPKLRRGSAGAAGLDLPIAEESVSLRPGETRRIKTGVRIALPPGHEAQVRPRSSASARGLLVYLGTIDSDYRGEIEIVVTNLSGEWARIAKPVAQLVIAEVANLPIEYVDALDDTPRGASGFGSSDKKGGA